MKSDKPLGTCDQLGVLHELKEHRQNWWCVNWRESPQASQQADAQVRSEANTVPEWMKASCGCPEGQCKGHAGAAGQPEAYALQVRQQAQKDAEQIGALTELIDKYLAEIARLTKLLADYRVTEQSLAKQCQELTAERDALKETIEKELQHNHMKMRAERAESALREARECLEWLRGADHEPTEGKS